MYHTKKMLLALLLVGSVSPAYAVTVLQGPGDLGTLNGVVSIGNSFGSASSINDVYKFDIASTSATVGTLVTINFDIPVSPGVEYGINNFTAGFWDSSNMMIAMDSQSSPMDTVVSVTTTLAPGLDYEFRVTGNVIGTMGGGYGGVLAAAPVPEANTYAMMLAGLGLLGFTVMRRRSI